MESSSRREVGTEAEGEDRARAGALDLGVEVWSLGFRVEGLARVWDLGFRV